MMLNYFDEYEQKDLSKRVSIEFNRSNDELLNPWQISNFIGRLSSYYYKLELINTLGLALNQGISPNNIFILDESFKPYQYYYNLYDINLFSKDILHLYNIGNPISLFPNKSIFEINKLFKMTRYIYENVKINNSHTYIKNMLWKYMERYKFYGFDKILEHIVQETIIYIEQNYTRSSAINTVTDNINKKYKSILSEYKKFELNENKISNIESSLKYYDEADFSTEDKDIINTYFMKFYYFIIKLSRPIIGIYYEESNMIQILCRAQINTKDRNETFLDFKRITHCSPYKVCIEGGLQLQVSLNRECIDDEQQYFERKKRELEVKKLESENDILEMQKIALAIDNCVKLSNLPNSPEVQAVKKINNYFIKKQAKEVHDKIVNGYTDLVERNGFEVNYKNTKVVEDLKNK